MVKQYYGLTKPGIVYGNDLSAIAGFFLASRGEFNLRLFLMMLLGLSLVIASSCVFNNLLDKKIDAVMERTKKRPLVTGVISDRLAVFYAVILGVLGASVLSAYVNHLTAAVALFGMLAYVALYGYFKRRSSLGTVIGSISGAAPPVVGYTAITNRIDLGAILLFLILVFWQMPHFYAIAIYRLKDYKKAKIPVLPSVRSLRFTEINIFLYTLGFFLAAVSLSFLGYTGMFYLLAMTLISLIWLLLSVQGFRVKDVDIWAKKMFFYSLITISAFCVIIPLDAFLSFR